ASEDLLPGITRDTVLRLAADLGLAVAEAPVCVADLLAADEVVLTGTGTGVTPVVEVSGRPIGTGVPGPWTRRLVPAYDELVRGGGDGRYAGWLTHVRLPPGRTP